MDLFVICLILKNDNRMIQFITHANTRYGYVEGARLALQGGCRWVQLRMKDADEATFWQQLPK